MVVNLVLFVTPGIPCMIATERIKGRKEGRGGVAEMAQDRCGCTIMKLKDELTMDLMRSLFRATLLVFVCDYAL